MSNPECSVVLMVRTEAERGLHADGTGLFLAAGNGQLVINIRKLAALDLVFHGPRFVLVEFGGAVVLTIVLAALSLRSAFLGHGQPIVWEVVLAGLLASIGANYLPLLIHAISLVRSGTAREEVAVELENASLSQRLYGTRQFLLAVPFAVLAMAIAQGMPHRNAGG